MADMTSTGMAWLKDQIKAHDSTTVVYGRGAFTVSVKAKLQFQLLRVTDRGGEGSKLERPDLTAAIAVEDLILNGSAITPQKGDRIDVTMGGATKRYTVLPIGSEPAWRYADPFEQMALIHAKRATS